MKRLVLICGLVLVHAPFGLHAAGDPEAGQQKSQACAGCHGPDGNSASPDFPKIAGQHASYTLKQLQDYKAGRRQNAIMSGMVANLSEQDMADLAAYYAQQERTPGYASEEQVALGRRIYHGGDKSSELPACMSCHGPTGTGNPLSAYPELNGQWAKYTEAQLRMFAAGERANDPNEMMRDVASAMTEAQIKAVAEYAAGLFSDIKKTLSPLAAPPE